MPRRVQTLGTLPKRKRNISTSTVSPNKKKSKLDEDEVNETSVLVSSVGAKKSATAKTVKNVDAEEIPSTLQEMCQFKKYLLTTMKHPVIPGFNANVLPPHHDVDLSNYPSICVSSPQVVFVSQNVPTHLDICHKRTRERSTHRALLKMARAKYVKVMQTKRNLRKVVKNQMYPIAVYDLAGRMECNPDPYFHGSYDYYYTGGNLSVLPYDVGGTGMRLLHVNGQQLQQMNAGVVNFMDCQPALKPLYSLNSIDTTSEVFELRSIQSPFARHSDIFVARQYKTVTFYALQADKQQMLPLKQFKSKQTPFISFAQAPSNTRNFVVSTMTQHLRLYDLETSKMQSYALDNSISWNMVRPWQRDQTYLYANENGFCFADMRTTVKEWQMLDLDGNLNCDLVSSMAISSKYDQLFYLASSHNLYCLDARKMNERNIVCRWTHQMEYAPAFVDTLPRGNSEIIALSSVLANDTCVCELTQKQNEELHYVSTALPYQPPTIHEAYDHARSVGSCLHPSADLKKRIQHCTTGICFATNGSGESDAVLLTSNSLGDIYAAKITQRSTDDEEGARADAQSDEQMTRYADTICAQTQPTLKYTHIADLSAMRRIFLCKNLSKTIKSDYESDDDIADKDEKKEIKNIRKYSSLGRWQKPMHTLYSYKDALVSNLLDIWDIDVDEKVNIDLGRLKDGASSAQPDTKANVKKWLSESEKVTAMVTIPINSETYQPTDRNAHSERTAVSAEVTAARTEIENFSMQMHSTQLTEANPTPLFDPAINESLILTQNTTLEMSAMTMLTSKPIKAQKKAKAKYVKGF